MLVLIVDDEPVVAHSTVEIFRVAGHEAHCATSNVEAIEIARQIRPDLLITDVVMPGKTGIELAIEITREMPSCKVLLISGQAEASDLLEEAVRHGYRFEIVAKPLWPPELIQHAERLVASNSNSDSATASG